MKYQVNKTVTETVEIDLANPIYRVCYGSMFYRLTATSDTQSEVTVISDRSICVIRNYSDTLTLINCEAEYKECTEDQFKLALAEQLAKLNLNY